MIRKIFTIGKYTAVVSISREIMRKLRWRSGQKVEVSAKRASLRVKDSK